MVAAGRGVHYLEDRRPIHFAGLIVAEIGGVRRPAGYA